MVSPQPPLEELTKKIRLIGEADQEVPIRTQGIEVKRLTAAPEGFNPHHSSGRIIKFNEIYLFSVFVYVRDPNHNIHIDIFTAGERRPFRVHHRGVSYQEFLGALDPNAQNNFYGFILYLLQQVDSVCLDAETINYLKTKQPASYQTIHDLEAHTRKIWHRIITKLKFACSGCSEIYWVDRTAIPEKDPRLRCKKCGVVFAIDLPGSDEQAGASPETPGESDASTAASPPAQAPAGEGGVFGGAAGAGAADAYQTRVMDQPPVPGQPAAAPQPPPDSGEVPAQSIPSYQPGQTQGNLDETVVQPHDASAQQPAGGDSGDLSSYFSSVSQEQPASPFGPPPPGGPSPAPQPPAAPPGAPPTAPSGPPAPGVPADAVSQVVQQTPGAPSGMPQPPAVPPGAPVTPAPGPPVTQPLSGEHPSPVAPPGAAQPTPAQPPAGPPVTQPPSGEQPSPVTPLPAAATPAPEPEPSPAPPPPQGTASKEDTDISFLFSGENSKGGEEAPASPEEAVEEALAEEEAFAEEEDIPSDIQKVQKKRGSLRKREAREGFSRWNRLTILSGAVILLSFFFLPWVKVQDKSVKAVEIMTESGTEALGSEATLEIERAVGQMSNSLLLWLIAIVAVIVIAFSLLSALGLLGSTLSGLVGALFTLTVFLYGFWQWFDATNLRDIIRVTGFGVYLTFFAMFVAILGNLIRMGWIPSQRLE
ncbi:hypothetical protein ACFLU6_05830 [Acidobacteriota bacterium]